MGFLDGLKGGKVPNELPDLAVETPSQNNSEPSRVVEQSPQGIKEELPSVIRPRQIAPPISQVPEIPKKEENHDQLVFQMPESLNEHSPEQVVGKVQDQDPEVLPKPAGEVKKVEEKIDVGELANESYFNGILEDINGEIQDIGNLEEWYNKKFLPQDVVSNMRGFWEGNKAEIIIKSFGSDYKKKINAKISKMSELEMDWREIYFKLVKKEEEMKKEERELKEILSEFVEICKLRGKPNGENKKSGK